MPSNYPPGVTGNEPQIVGYDDGPKCQWCGEETWIQQMPASVRRIGGPSYIVVCPNGHVEENYDE